MLVRGLVFLPVLFAFVAAAPAAEAVPIHYDLVVLLQPGSVLLDSTGGVTFDDASFTPNGTVAADDIDFEFTFTWIFTYTLDECTGLTGHVDGSGTAVTALSGVCTDDDAVSDAIITFSPDNTAFIEFPSLLLAFNATYSVPEPRTALLHAALALFVGGMRRRG